MLLIIEALLLISAALLQDHGAAFEGQVLPLDMAPNSVDDQYAGCTVNMTDLVEKKYLNKEISHSSAFENAWKKGEESFTKPRDNLTKKHSIAIYVYTNSIWEIYKDLNYADRNGKRSYKKQKYTWYSLHFLLTDAIQILKKTQKKCFSTYRGTKLTYDEKVLHKEVRFGSFASSTMNRNKTRFFGKTSCFEIHTCEGADVSEFSKLPQEEEVLIPPYETFKITAVRKRKVDKSLWCDTVFTLKSSGVRSDLNCALFKKPFKTEIKFSIVH